MKAILKPEDEIIVTPGKKAVEDFLGLPAAGLGSTLLMGVKAYDGKRVIEEADLIVSAQNIDHPDEIGPPFMKYDEAMYAACHVGGYLASSALTFAVLCELLDKGDQYKSVLNSMLTPVTSLYWQNTLVDWDSSTVIHYPNMHDLLTLQDREVNVLRDRSELSIPDETFLEEYDLKALSRYDSAQTLVQKLLGIPDIDQLKRILTHVNLELKLRLPSGKEQMVGQDHVTMGCKGAYFQIDVHNNADDYHQVRKVLRR